MDEGLQALGFDAGYAAAAAGLGEPGLVPARVVVEHGRFYRVDTGGEELLAVTAGKLRHRVDSAAELPVVGDWVALQRGDTPTIRHVLPRRTRLARRGVGRRDHEQVVVANVDTVLLVMGLDADFNTRRLERYLALAHAGGVRPVVVLNKADLCADVEARQAAVVAVAPGVPILTTSLVAAGGHEAVQALLEPGRTLALLGSSGAGKSTLLNRLSGVDVQRTAAVRLHDSRGRHTTSFAQLFRLPGGALAVDTPGLRELALTDDTGAGLEGAFDDVAALAAGCRFRDCRHDREPACAVRDAVASGALPSARFDSYLKLRGELDARQRRRY